MSVPRHAVLASRVPLSCCFRQSNPTRVVSRRNIEGATQNEQTGVILEGGVWGVLRLVWAWWNRAAGSPCRLKRPLADSPPPLAAGWIWRSCAAQNCTRPQGNPCAFKRPTAPLWYLLETVQGSQRKAAQGAEGCVTNKGNPMDNRVDFPVGLP